MSSRLPNRRRAEIFSITLLGEPGNVEGDGGTHPPGHKFHVTIGRDDAGHVQEVFFVGRGKSGHGLDILMAELGVKLSRLIQDRHPETGDPL